MSKPVGEGQGKNIRDANKQQQQPQTGKLGSRQVKWYHYIPIFGWIAYLLSSPQQPPAPTRQQTPPQATRKRKVEVLNPQNPPGDTARKTAVVTGTGAHPVEKSPDQQALEEAQGNKVAKENELKDRVNLHQKADALAAEYNVSNYNTNAPYPQKREAILKHLNSEYDAINNSFKKAVQPHLPPGTEARNDSHEEVLEKQRAKVDAARSKLAQAELDIPRRAEENLKNKHAEEIEAIEKENQQLMQQLSTIRAREQVLNTEIQKGLKDESGDVQAQQAELKQLMIDQVEISEKVGANMKKMTELQTKDPLENKAAEIERLKQELSYTSLQPALDREETTLKGMEATLGGLAKQQEEVGANIAELNKALPQEGTTLKNTEYTAAIQAFLKAEYYEAKQADPSLTPQAFIQKHETNNYQEAKNWLKGQGVDTTNPSNNMQLTVDMQNNRFLK